MLWLEADRMKSLDFSAKNLANQQDVVKEEIRVNVKNQPYGRFFWTDLSRSRSTSGRTTTTATALQGPGPRQHRRREGLPRTSTSRPTRCSASPATSRRSRPSRWRRNISATCPRARRRRGRTSPKPLNTREAPCRADRRAGPGAGAGDRLEDARRAAARTRRRWWCCGELLAGDDASRFYQGLVKGRELRSTSTAV